MAFPAKFKHLIENAKHEATIPDYADLAFAVCAVEESSCGWSGWIIEVVWQKDGWTPNMPEWGGQDRDAPLWSADNQICPNCKRTLFRTGLGRRYLLDPNPPPKLAFDYDVEPIEYE